MSNIGKRGPVISWSAYCTRIFLAKMIQWSEATPLKEKYISRFKELFIHFLSMNIKSGCALGLFGYVLVHSFPSIFLEFSI